METSTTLEKINDGFADGIIDSHSQLNQDTVIVSRSVLVPLAERLREDPELSYDYLMDLTATDYWKRRPRFEMVYHFLSTTHNTRLRVKVPLGEQNPEVDSLVRFWPVANWYEREVYDMFGIRFKDHPNLRRILLYPEFKGHPLRKDYPINKRQPLVGPNH